MRHEPMDLVLPQQQKREKIFLLNDASSSTTTSGNKRLGDRKPIQTCHVMFSFEDVSFRISITKIPNARRILVAFSRQESQCVTSTILRPGCGD
ncbi:hypothetical protein RRG08_030122 [Elysia crispata]|uniref:Uncharacterized protein n=1 Tax=Elysia crispata TaxID=231223 RepID=A0AAE0ZRD0_9GAST|nr:hypothetical protein RRG08_030122 [Elysia crispata]